METPIKTSIVAPALLAVLLAGCGGGGGGGTTAGANNSVSPAAPTAVAITQANATAVAAQGMDAAQDNSASSSASLITGVEVDGSSSLPGPLTIAAVAQHFGQRASGLPLATGVAIDQTVTCSNGGTIRLAGSIASNTGANAGLNAGDSVTATASNCSELVNGVLTTMNGTLRIDVASGLFPASGVMPYHVVLRTTAAGLTVQTGSNLNSIDGDMSLDINVASATSQVLTVTGNSLSSSATVAGVKRSRTLTAYSQKVSVSGGTVTGSISGGVATTSTRLGSGGGSFTVSTPQDLRWTTASNAPVAGQLKIVGASNSAVLITFGATDVTVQVDANGDGTFESSSTTSVAQLRTLL